MERKIEAALLGARWLLLPLYAAVLASVLMIYGVVGRELWRLIELLPHGGETEMLVLLFSVLDLVLVANLLVMVAISSYESYVSRIAANGEGQPEWLGKLDSGNVKLKVAISITMISAIHLLRAFMMDTSTERLAALAGVHVIFILSALGTALVDRMQRKTH
jgi:uncharacterized protein (TIGR00645 family)